MEVIEEVMMPVVIKMAEDAVPNVRFNVAKSLTKITSRVGQGSVTVSLGVVLYIYSGTSE